MNATLLGQAFAFAMFVWFCMKYVWPPILDAIEERQDKIKKGLEDAERADRDLTLAQANASNHLKEAKRKATEVLDEANKKRAEILELARHEAIEEKNKIMAQTKIEIDAERIRLKNELRKQVSTLAIAGAERILERSIDGKIQDDMLNDIIAKL